MIRLGTKLKEFGIEIAEWLNSWRRWTIILIVAGSLVVPVWFFLCPEAKLATQINQLKIDLSSSRRLDYGIDNSHDLSIKGMNLLMDAMRDQELTATTPAKDYRLLMDEPIPYQTSVTEGKQINLLK